MLIFGLTVMKEKGLLFLKPSTAKETRSSVRKKHGLGRSAHYGIAFGTYHNDSKVYKAALNRISEIALVKAVTAKNTGGPQALLNTGYFAPVKNMIKHVQIAGVNVTIDPSLPTFENDAFIMEKTKRANMKFSNEG